MNVETLVSQRSTLLRKNHLKPLKISITEDHFNDVFLINGTSFITQEITPEGYIDTLPKWYSFKFTYPNYNLIFIRPEFGLSIQVHKYRDEQWEILKGKPIVISKDKVYYYVEKGAKFQNKNNTYHSIINPNKEKYKFVLIKENWSGNFDEKDIERVFNPNHYE